MSRSAPLDAPRPSPGGCVITTLAIALGAMPGAAMAVHLEYVIDAGVERNDNVTLTEIDPIEEDIFRSGVGFALTQDTSVIQAGIIGRAEYRNYLGGAFANTVDGTLAGHFNWFAIPDRLSFRIDDSLTVQPVNAFAANTPGNRQQVNVLSLGPNLYFNLADGLRGQAELRYTTSDAEITDEFNSRQLALAVRAEKELSSTSRASLNLQGQRVDFEDDVFARDYTRYDVFARYARDMARFALSADLGYSRLRYQDTGDTRSEPLLRATVDWLPNPRHRLSLAASQQFSDAATDALAGIEDVADGVDSVPTSILTGDAVVNASAFKEQRLSLGYAFTGHRLRMSLTPYLSNLDYVDSDEFDQDGHGVDFNLDWQLRPRLVVGAFASLDDIDYSRIQVSNETRLYGVHLRHDWSRHWSARIECAHQERRSNVAGDSADQNVVYLSIIYQR